MREIATPGGPIDVGLGWFRPREARSTLPRYVEHLGGGLGICNVMRLYPDLQLGVVLMANAPGYDLEAILARIAAEVGRGIR
jgi:CubicO group peptidase (beta-lactamase class C family)